MKKIIALFLFTLTMPCFAQTAISESEVKINPLINGTLFSPQKTTPKTRLLILIAGSGPTDRNGNQKGMETDCSKLLARALAQKGIAVFSYDKRIIAQMKAGTVDEKSLSFEDMIGDAKDVVTFFKAQKKYAKIVIGGHSEGSLIGMIAANGNVDAFLSIAGPGRTADELIIEQVTKQAPQFETEIREDFAILKSGKTFELKNPMLGVLFRESLQPYMISWLKYDPKLEIKKLKIPVMLINGTKDLQVGVSELELLKQSRPDAKFEVVENMNHVLKEITGDDAENQASYNKPELPVSAELVTAMGQFIQSF